MDLMTLRAGLSGRTRSLTLPAMAGLLLAAGPVTDLHAQTPAAIPECAPPIQRVCDLDPRDFVKGPPEGTRVVPDPPDVPVTLEPLHRPVPAVPIGEGDSTAGARYRINVHDGLPWASSRNEPLGFFVNSVRDDTIMTVVKGQRTTGPNGETQHYMGDIDHYPNWFCGWVFAMNMDPLERQGTSRCPSDWTLAPSRFSQYINCETCRGGWTVSLAHSVTYVRNVYPWAPNHEVHDYSISRPAGYEVHWRYVSEDGNWVAVSDTDPDMHMKWFFVPKSALPNICGGGADAGPPSTPERQDWGLVCKSEAEGG